MMKNPTNTHYETAGELRGGLLQLWQCLSELERAMDVVDGEFRDSKLIMNDYLFVSGQLKRAVDEFYGRYP